jgi:hypothetical protein
MWRWDSFGRSLAFAALAAAGLPVAVTFAGALIGDGDAARLYLIAAAGIYAAGLCPDRSRRFAAFASAAFAGMILALLPLDLRHTAIGAAGIVAFARGFLLPDTRNLRALAIEVAFGSAGLATAAWFARGGLLALCLAIWGYFLVQSGYFLIGARGPGYGETTRDPFDLARARLQRLLEDDPA